MTATAEKPAIDQVTPAKLFQVANGFCTAKILLTALDLDLFELLDGPALTEAELREQLDLAPRASWHFLNALVWLGFLERDGAGYRNSAVSSGYLVRGRPTYMGGFLSRANSLFYPAWGRFEEALHSGKPVTAEHEDDTAYEQMITDAEQLRSFLAMMDAMSAPLARELAQVLDWTGVTSVVDCGGARGNLAATLARAHPHLAAAVFDRPLVQPMFDEHMAKLGTTGAVTFRPGDFFADDLPSADRLIFGHVLHDWSEEQRITLVRKAFAALPPGGTLVVYDPMVDEALARPMNLVISLDLLLTTEGGAEYPAADCVRWFTDAGFVDVTQRSLGYNDTLVVGRKPAV
jgi:hypothetical protein